MAAAELALKSPSVPLFQRGNFLGMALTPPFDGLRAGFGKEGKGRFSNGMSCDYVADFWDRTLD
jgi:hypothetical protein